MDEFIPPSAGGSGGSPLAFLQMLQALVQATNAQAQNIKNLFIGAASSGDISGSYPGPITVNKTNGVAFTPYATAARGQLLGTNTNDNGAAGFVREEIESTVLVGAALPLTTLTPLTITSIALTPGDWDVWSYVGFSGNGATTVNFLLGSISLVNNTLDLNPGRSAVDVFAGAPAIFGVGNPISFACGQFRLPLNANTTVFLIADAGFAVNTCSAFGFLAARRR